MDVAIRSVVAAGMCSLCCAAALAQTAPAPVATAVQVTRSVFDGPPSGSAASGSVTGSVAVPAPTTTPVSDEEPRANRQLFDPAPYVLTDSGRSVVLGRYSTSSSVPPEYLSEPIDVVVSLVFPRQTVRTIGEAINFTLLRSGYRFDDSAANDAARQFLDLPLPESQRQVGPYSVKTILDVLSGSAWQMQVNRVNRTVTIQLKAAYAYAAAAVKPASAAVPAAPATSVTPSPAPTGVAVRPGRTLAAATPYYRSPATRPHGGDLVP